MGCLTRAANMWTAPKSFCQLALGMKSLQMAFLDGVHHLCKQKEGDVRLAQAAWKQRKHSGP